MTYLEAVREAIACGDIPEGQVRAQATMALRRALEAQERGSEHEATELARFYVDASQWLGSARRVE